MFYYDHMDTCRYLGPYVSDLFVPGGIYIIVNNFGAFPKIQDINGRLYYIKPEHYELVDAYGERLERDLVNKFHKGLTNRLAVVT